MLEEMDLVCDDDGGGGGGRGGVGGGGRLSAIQGENTVERERKCPRGKGKKVLRVVSGCRIICTAAAAAK